jgi:hypothetical protein
MAWGARSDCRWFESAQEHDAGNAILMSHSRPARNDRFAPSSSGHLGFAGGVPKAVVVAAAKLPILRLRKNEGSKRPDKRELATGVPLAFQLKGSMHPAGVCVDGSFAKSKYTQGT